MIDWTTSALLTALYIGAAITAGGISQGLAFGVISTVVAADLWKRTAAKRRHEALQRRINNIG